MASPAGSPAVVCGIPVVLGMLTCTPNTHFKLTRPSVLPSSVAEIPACIAPGSSALKHRLDRLQYLKSAPASARRTPNPCLRCKERRQSRSQAGP